MVEAGKIDVANRKYLAGSPAEQRRLVTNIQASKSKGHDLALRLGLALANLRYQLILENTYDKSTRS